MQRMAVTMLSQCLPPPNPPSPMVPPTFVNTPLTACSIPRLHCTRMVPTVASVLHTATPPPRATSPPRPAPHHHPVPHHRPLTRAPGCAGGADPRALLLWPVPTVWRAGEMPPFSLREVGWWMCDIITGLVHMHHSLPEPLLHRNLSPANLLVSSASRRVATLAASGAGAGATTADPSYCWADVVVKLGGLGSAEAVPEGHDHYSSQPGEGVVATMAPQAIRGVYDTPGDVYAWAKCICWVVRDALRLPRSESELRTSFVVRLQTHARAWGGVRGYLPCLPHNSVVPLVGSDGRAPRNPSAQRSPTAPQCSGESVRLCRCSLR